MAEGDCTRGCERKARAEAQPGRAGAWHCESQCQGSSKCGLSQGRTSSHGSLTFQGGIFPVHEATASRCPRSLRFKLCTGRWEAEPTPHVQGYPSESWTHEQPSAVGSAWNTGRAGAEVPEAKSPVDGWSPSPGACSMGSLPGAGHTRDTNLAWAACPAAPQARCLWGSLELGCSLGHPGWAHPAAPGALHGGKRQSRVILWGQSLLSLQCWLPVVGMPCQHSWGHTNVRDQPGTSSLWRYQQLAGKERSQLCLLTAQESM